MKTQFSFPELAQVLTLADKYAKAAADYEAQSSAYNEISIRFDEEFKKHGWTFRNAPQSLFDLFDNKDGAMLQRDKIGRKAMRIAKTFGELIGIGTNYPDIVEEKVARFLSTGTHCDIPAMAERVKHLALVATQKANIYA